MRLRLDMKKVMALRHNKVAMCSGQWKVNAQSSNKLVGPVELGRAWPSWDGPAHGASAGAPGPNAFCAGTASAPAQARLTT